MKKVTTILLALLVIGIVSASIAFAYGGRFGASKENGTKTHYQDMQKIIENGTYTDLVEYRQTTGFNVMPCVQNEDDFTQAKQRHLKMGQYGQNNGQCGQGFGKRGGCPMLNDGDE